MKQHGQSDDLAMNNFTIMISCDNAEIWENGSIIDTGFCVKVVDFFFPHEDWTDYAYPLLGMWAENVICNIGRQSSRYSLFFMDGSYRINVIQRGVSLLLSGIDDRNPEQIVFSYQCTTYELLKSIMEGFFALEKTINTNKKLFSNNQIISIRETVRHYKDSVSYLLNSEHQ